MRALYEPKNDFIYIMLNGVEVVVDYNADVGTHIDVLVHSKSKSFDNALDIVHEHIMDKILERCVATDGCQGVVLVEGVSHNVCENLHVFQGATRPICAFGRVEAKCFFSWE
jgi:hypothetical protein